MLAVFIYYGDSSLITTTATINCGPLYSYEVGWPVFWSPFDKWGDQAKRSFGISKYSHLIDRQVSESSMFFLQAHR